MKRICSFRHACAALALALCLAAPGLVMAQDAPPSPGRKPVVGEFYVQPPDPPAPAMVQSLRKHIDHLLRKVYVKPEDLYSPPAEGTEGFTYDQVTPQEAVPVLAGNVAAMTGEIEGLAVAGKDGAIHVWSNFPCRQMNMPGGRTPMALAWGRGSPVLAAVEPGGGAVQLFDLRSCAPPRPAALPAGARIRQAAMSDMGNWLAFVAEDGGLWAGPPPGPFTRVEGLDQAPLMIGFTPMQGVLAAADAKGQVVAFALMNRKVLRRIDVPGGPFVQGWVAGQSVTLATASGQATSVSLLTQAEAQPVLPPDQGETGRIFVRDGKVFYTTGLTRWLKTTRMRRPEFILSHSPSLGLLRLRDLDGETRYYSATSGDPAPEPSREGQDWVLQYAKDGLYAVQDHEFRAFDPVCQSGYQRLYCRFIPGKGYFLWWQGQAVSRDWNPRPMHLPVRGSLRADQEPAWIDLHGGTLP